MIPNPLQTKQFRKYSRAETGEQSAAGIDDVIDVEVDMSGRHPVRISAELWAGLLRE